MKPLLFITIVQYHVETSRHRYNQLLKILMGMTTSLGTAGDIVEIVNSLYVKRYVRTTLDKSKIAPRIVDFWQVYYSAVFNRHDFSIFIDLFFLQIDLAALDVNVESLQKTQLSKNHLYYAGQQTLLGISFNEFFTVVICYTSRIVAYAKGIYMSTKKAAPSFSHSLRELEAVASRLEDNDMSLELSLKDFESGIQLIRQAQKALQETEQKVLKLLDQEGNMRAASLPATGAENDTGK
jgi:exodeoxyribonuclease VII small subunit